jgi:hypothetical protein
MMNDPQLVGEFEAALQKLVGLECWSIVGGKPHSTLATFDFGQKIERRVPLNYPQLSSEQRSFYGEISLVTCFCPWRVETPDTVIGSWTDRSDNGAPLMHPLENLIGLTVERVELARPALDLILTFTTNLTLRLFCDQTNEQDGGDNYIYFAPDRSYSVELHSKLHVS